MLRRTLITVMCMISMAFAQASDAPIDVTISGVLHLTFAQPATRFYLAPVTAKTYVQAGRGLVVTLGPQTAMVVSLYDWHGDDSSGWSAGQPCAKQAEVLVWRGAGAGEALTGLVNSARRSGWQVGTDLSTTFRKNGVAVEALLVPYGRGPLSAAVAVLCRQ